MTETTVTIPDNWQQDFTLIPGYNPVTTSAPGDYFDVTCADNAVGFFADCLQLFEGVEGGSQPFVLEPWQRAVVGCLFGWKQANGLRRYREAMIYVPRKNGKTPWMAGILCYMMFCDDEPGAQLYSAAAEKEQASLVFRHAAGMIQREPELDSRCRIYRTFKSIEVGGTSTIYKALSADADTKHGFNSHFVVVDELHAHRNRDLVDVLVTSTGSRRQPLIVYITTADFDRESICNEKHDYASKVRDGVFEDHSFLPVIYEAATDADWTDPAVWAKANPNLGVSVRLEYLERECKRAQDQPTYENTFKRLHLNIKTQQDVRWLSLDKWDASAGIVDADALAGRVCYAGVDLSQKQDITALVLAFPDEDGGFDVLPYFWLPENSAHERERRDRVPYLTWANQGLIELTPGNVIDYGFIRKQIASVKERFNLREIAFDPWGATHFAQQLQDEDGMTMIQFRQGFSSMSEPTKHLEALVMSKKLRHGGNPVLRWMAGNVACKTDASGNIKLDKEKSTERIDGMVALVMAIGRAMTPEPVEEYITPTVF